jgi:hypothetical protein
MSPPDNELILQLISERVDGLRILSEHGFADIRRELSRVQDLPVRVEQLAGLVEQHQQRLNIIEETGTRGIEYRRASLPIIILTLALVCSGIATVLTQVH